MTSHFCRTMTMTASVNISGRFLDRIIKAGRGPIVEYREIGGGMQTIKVRTQAKGQPSDRVQANIIGAVRAIAPDANWD